MAKFVSLYDKPEDVEGFEKHFRSTHMPIVDQYPGIQALRITRFTSTPRGTEAPFYLMVEVEFPTDEEMAAALRSEPAIESARDAKGMAEQFGVKPTLLLGTDF